MGIGTEGVLVSILRVTSHSPRRVGLYRLICAVDAGLFRCWYGVAERMYECEKSLYIAD
jgi:hypothetical protein